MRLVRLETLREGDVFFMYTDLKVVGHQGPAPRVLRPFQLKEIHMSGGYVERADIHELIEDSDGGFKLAEKPTHEFFDPRGIDVLV